MLISKIMFELNPGKRAVLQTLKCALRTKLRRLEKFNFVLLDLGVPVLALF